MIFLLLPLLSLPAVVIFLLGARLYPHEADGAGSRRWILFLLGAAIGLALPLAVFSERVLTGDVIYGLILELPTLIGVLTLALIHAPDIRSRWMAEPFLVSALLLILAALLGALALGERSLLMGVTVPPIAMAAAWMIGRRFGLKWIHASGLLLGLWLLMDSLGLLFNHRMFTTPRLWVIYEVGGPLVMSLSLVSLALLLGKVAQADERGGGRSFRRSLAVAAFLGLTFLMAIFRGGLMVNATAHAAEDHMPVGMAALVVIAGLSLAFGLSKRRTKLGLAFAVIGPLLIGGTYAAGWMVNPQAVTTARAGRIDQAIARYHQERGVYPSRLGELTPNYLPVLMGPLTGRGQAWCYQAGEDYYRLGYAFYQRYHDSNGWSPLSGIRIYNEAGPFPSGPWICDQERELLRETRGL
jgi:hypothetical protein